MKILRELEIALAKIEAVKENLAKRPPGPSLLKILVFELDDITKILRNSIADSVKTEGEGPVKVSPKYFKYLKYCERLARNRGIVWEFEND